MLKTRTIVGFAATACVVLACSTASARTIRGTIWCAGADPDCGQDAQPGPEVLENVVVGLCDGDGNPLQDNGIDVTTTTDDMGEYRFTDLVRFDPIIVFTVKIIDDSMVPANKELTTLNCLNTENGAGCAETDVPDPSVCAGGDLAGKSQTVDMEPVIPGCGTNINGIDFVYCDVPDPCLGTIGDLVWVDENGDGVKDAGENGLPDVRLVLCDGSGAEIASAITDADGNYLFEGLCAGDYCVKVDESTVSSSLVACGELGDSRASPYCTTLADDNSSDLTADFCYFRPEPPTGGEGCTPGYWKNRGLRVGDWTLVSPDDLFVDVFGSDVFGDQTLLDILRIRGGGVNALGRHSVAALLNALSPDVSYGLTADEVIDAFNDAVDSGDADVIEGTKDVLDGLNNEGCPL